MMQHFQNETVLSSIRLRDLIIGLWPFIKRYPWWLTAGVAFTLIHIIVARLIPNTVGAMVDQGIIPKNYETFWYWAIIYAIAQVVYTASYFIYAISFARLGNRSINDLRLALMDQVQKLPMDYFHKNPSGRILNRLTHDPATLQEFFSGEGVINVPIQLLMLISIVIAMSLISVKMTLLSLLSVPVFVWLAFRVIRQVRFYQRKAKDLMGALSAFATERLGGIKTIHVTNATEQTSHEFSQLSDEYKVTLQKLVKTGAMLHPILNTITALVVTTLLVSTGVIQENQTLSLGSITALILHALDLIYPLREILERYQQFQNSLTSSERIFPIFREPLEESVTVRAINKSKLQTPRQENKINDSDNKYLDQTKLGRIDFKNVTFSYRADQKPILRELSITIFPGEKVAIIGKTGAGKSTLIQLLQRFYVPNSGEILLDGENIERIPLPLLRKKIGAIQQDPLIFKGDLKSNMTLGNTDYSDTGLIELMQQLGIEDYFKKKGMSLNHPIEEKGNNLSQGEKQLINFIRIFVFQPTILVFDEASANLDSETETLLQKAWLTISQGRTSILIAHRLSTLRQCDNIYLLQNGTLHPIALNEVESHPELLEMETHLKQSTQPSGSFLDS
ncbi:MAG: ABC transporter ATP-binding protein/permease [Bdellovibrionaceae bacterium]|nr:ABC transporter ATP-binding protein/permease [Pseudobdellovibrionaceae bacterium]